MIIASQSANTLACTSGSWTIWSLLDPIGDGGRLNDHLVAVAMPRHAPGHMGYVLNSGEDRILFCGDLIHVPAAQFARPELT